MWFITFAKGSRRIGVIGTGAPAAAQAPPVVTGIDYPGNELSCTGAGWSTWAGQQPSVSAYGLDGYTWLLDGHPIAGQNGQSLLAAAADAGHQISCEVTASYPLLNVTVHSAVSAAVSIGPPIYIPPAYIGVPAASMLTLPRQTETVTRAGALRVTLDCSGAPCSGTIKLTFKTKLATGKGRHKRSGQGGAEAEQPRPEPAQASRLQARHERRRQLRLIRRVACGHRGNDRAQGHEAQTQKGLATLARSSTRAAAAQAATGASAGACSNASAPSSASTFTESPLRISPDSSASASRSVSCFWITRRSGRAP